MFFAKFEKIKSIHEPLIPRNASIIHSHPPNIHLPVSPSTYPFIYPPTTHHPPVHPPKPYFHHLPVKQSIQSSLHLVCLPIILKSYKVFDQTFINEILTFGCRTRYRPHSNTFGYCHHVHNPEASELVLQHAAEELFWGHDVLEGMKSSQKVCASLWLTINSCYYQPRLTPVFYLTSLKNINHIKAVPERDF